MCRISYFNSRTFEALEALDAFPILPFRGPERLKRFSTAKGAAQLRLARADGKSPFPSQNSPDKPIISLNRPSKHRQIDCTFFPNESASTAEVLQGPKRPEQGSKAKNLPKNQPDKKNSQPEKTRIKSTTPRDVRLRESQENQTVSLHLFPEDQTIMMTAIPHPGIIHAQRQQALIIMQPDPLILRHPQP